MKYNLNPVSRCIRGQDFEPKIYVKNGSHTLGPTLGSYPSED
jgi:hypothetical protein